MSRVGDAFKNQNVAIGLYLTFFFGCAIVYRSLVAREYGAYDYLLTLSAALQALGFTLLVFDSRSSVAEGLSEKTLWAFVVAHVARISTTIWGSGYIPEDNTSDVYLYQTLELLSVALVVFQLLKLAATRSQHDVGQGFERWSLLVGMTVSSLVLALLTKSTGHNDYYADLSWMFSVWLEAFALAPQVWFLLSAGQVDEGAAHFGGLTLAASVVFGLFWGRVARDRYAEFEKDGEHRFFQGILLAAFIRICFCCVYVYLFVRKASKAKSTYEPLGDEI